MSSKLKAWLFSLVTFPGKQSRILRKTLENLKKAKLPLYISASDGKRSQVADISTV